VQSRSKGQPFYGAGSIEIAATSVTLRAWQRSWLGAEEAIERAWTTAQIRNAVCTDDVVRFDARVGRRWRPVLFSAGDRARAMELLAALPRTRTDDFDETWAGLQEFNRLLDAANRRSWVTPALVISNFAAFGALLYLSGGGIDPVVMARWANAGVLTTQGEWWRLFTAAFLHWNLLHILLNMWVLWNAGRLAERLYGSIAFAGIYLACGVIGNLASTLWNPWLTTAGASGAVFGVLGALLACMLQTRGLPRVVINAHRWSTLAFVLLNLLIGAVTAGVDNAAHIGGLLTGFALGWLLAQSMVPGGRAEPSPWRAAMAVAMVSLVSGLGMHVARSPAPDPAGPYAWTQRHAWYLGAEARHMRRAERLNRSLSTGEISPADFAASVKSDLLPFLDDAGKRLAAETPTGKPASADSYSAMAREYVKARHDWLQASVVAIESGSDADRAKADSLQYAADGAQARLAVAQLREQFNGRSTGLRAALLDRYWSLKLLKSDACALPPAQWHYVAVPTDSKTDGPWLRRAAGCEAQRLLLQRDYRQLEGRVATALANLNDLPDGTSTYSGIFAGISHTAEYGGLPPELLLERFADWRRQYPGSAVPDLLESNLYQELAWAARGSGFAKSVRAQDWALFRYRIHLAQAILDAVAPRASGHPYWYTMSINVGLDGTTPVESLRATFDEGARRFPEYLPMYGAMLRVLMPRWQGSAEAVADFIEEVSRFRDDSTYARLYAIYASLEGDQGNVFDGPVDWERMREGLRQLQARYPESDFVLNQFAYLACRQGDTATYTMLRERMGERPSSTAWSEVWSPAACDKSIEAAAASQAGLVSTPLGDGAGTLATIDAEWVRRQTSAALEAAEPVRAAITRYFEQHGTLPSDDLLHAAPEFRASSPMGTAVSVGVGVSIDMKLIGGPLDGRKFSWTPLERDGAIQWLCAEGTVPARYLGPPCRDAEAARTP
jgi:rhomboid protease GluP